MRAQRLVVCPCGDGLIRAVDAAKIRKAGRSSGRPAMWHKMVPHWAVDPIEPPNVRPKVTRGRVSDKQTEEAV